MQRRANHADQKKKPHKINIHAMTSQYEISCKNYICSVKTKPSRA